MAKHTERFFSVLYFLILFEILCTESRHCRVDPKQDFCSNPKEAENFDYTWLQMQISSQRAWNIQLGNPILRSHIGKYLKEMDVTNDNDLADICAQDMIDEFDQLHFTGRFIGFGDQVSHWNCSFHDNTNDCDFKSVNDVFAESGKYYLTYFDGVEGHNLLGNVICFKNGDVGWYASTVSKSISEEETETVLKHFKSLGFNTKNHVKIRSPACT